MKPIMLIGIVLIGIVLIVLGVDLRGDWKAQRQMNGVNSKGG